MQKKGEVKRWKGVRFDPNSLKDYQGSPPIEVRRKRNRHPIQEELFYEKSPEGFRKHIGAFYEILSEGIFGGTWLGTNILSKNGGMFKPDIFNKQLGVTTEVKAISWNDLLKLTDYQIDKYTLQQCESFFFEIPEGLSREIFFAIYKYKIDKPLKELKNAKGSQLEYLVSRLSKETGFLLYLPFSILERLHNPQASPQYYSRYERERWDAMGRFSSRGMKEMLASPESVIESYGLNPEDYNIERTRLPEGVRMNNNGINPFPILFVSDKDHEAWLKKFKKENEERIKRIIEESRKKADYIGMSRGEMLLEGCSDFEEEIEYTPIEEEEEIPF